MVIASTRLPFPLVARGKVRDVYDVGGDRLLMVATDRISAFDVVLPQPIPHKGEVLTLITAWWLARLEDITPNHLISVDPAVIAREVPALAGLEAEWARRSMLVRRTEPFPVECVVRGYIAGSAWAEYRRTGTLAGEPLPGGLVESARLEAPIFSPATKAVEGHDENITFEGVRERVGERTAELLRERSLAIYERGREIAAAADIIIADTKFEFGRLPDGTVLLIDEVLTPDSSRFWPKESYAPGRAQPSLDKQPVRDHLESLVERGAWDKRPPAPELPPEVVEATSQRYRDVFRRLTGYALEAFPIHDPAQPPPARGGR
ncbi:MAG TPA: phosphoribosylaminoimidazolesuccinocarboxamide synthase [Longimicrobiales bacterium]